MKRLLLIIISIVTIGNLLVPQCFGAEYSEGQGVQSKGSISFFDETFSSKPIDNFRKTLPKTGEKKEVIFLIIGTILLLSIVLTFTQKKK